MSKKWIPKFKSKAEKAVDTTAQPREKAELDKEYTELCSKAGQLQYDIAAKEQLLMQYNARINALVGEANARAALDKKEGETDVQT
jgi:Tfp pilus assembly protein FimV